MKALKLLFPFLLFVLLLSACSPVPAAPATPQTTPTASAPAQSPEVPPATGIEGATQTVIKMLAAQLGVEPSAIKVVEAAPVEWADSCLGVHLKDVMCAQVVTPGYKIVLQYQGQTYEYHTNVDASNVQVAAVPTAQASNTAIAWQQQDQQGCSTAEINLNGVAYGVCGQQLTSGQFVSQDRVDEFKHFVETFQSFSVMTPAGQVTLQGQGNQAASGAEQRAIGEWARLVFEEAQAGRGAAASGLAIGWHREGGIAGFCNDLAVYVTGVAYATSCKNQQAANLGKVYLSTDELTQLYAWTDSLKNTEYNHTDPATADAMTIRMVFNGSGDKLATDQDVQAMLAFANQVYNQAARGQ